MRRRTKRQVRPDMAVAMSRLLGAPSPVLTWAEPLSPVVVRLLTSMARAESRCQTIGRRGWKGSENEHELHPPERADERRAAELGVVDVKRQGNSRGVVEEEERRVRGRPGFAAGALEPLDQTRGW